MDAGDPSYGGHELNWYGANEPAPQMEYSYGFDPHYSFPPPHPHFYNSAYDPGYVEPAFAEPSYGHMHSFDGDALRASPYAMHSLVGSSSHPHAPPSAPPSATPMYYTVVPNGEGGGLAIEETASESKKRKLRNRPQPWTTEEHQLFLAGLQKYGRGNWRQISQDMLKTRTTVQIASHAQKYFQFVNENGCKRRRSSIFFSEGAAAEPEAADTPATQPSGQAQQQSQTVPAPQWQLAQGMWNARGDSSLPNWQSLPPLPSQGASSTWNPQTQGHTSPAAPSGAAATAVSAANDLEDPPITAPPFAGLDSSAALDTYIERPPSATFEDDDDEDCGAATLAALATTSALEAALAAKEAAQPRDASSEVTVASATKPAPSGDSLPAESTGAKQSVGPASATGKSDAGDS